jgi:hypothetical protein
MPEYEDFVIKELKICINDSNLENTINTWNKYKNEINFGRELAWDYIFQKVYLHSSLKKHKHICEWLDTIFKQFDPIIQISLRQMFSYARYLMNK